MKRIILYVFCLFIIQNACPQTDSLCSQDNNFELILKLPHADFNYSFINDIDTCFWTNDIQNIIRTEGEYSIYVFKRSEMRLSYNKYYGKCFSPLFNILVPDSLNDTIVLAKGMDSVSLLFWNIYTTNKYEGYVFSFNQRSYTLTLRANFGDAKVFKINNIWKLNTIVQNINRFYILKSSPIIQKKTAKEKIVCTDYPTITISVYKNKCQKIFTSSQVETESYVLTINPDFLHFWELLLELINEYDTTY